MRRTRSAVTGHDNDGYLFIVPQWIIFIVFFAFSLAFLARTSLFRIGITFRNGEYVGLKHFWLAFTDPVLYRSILNNVIFAAGRIATAMTLGFLFSVFLSFGVPLKRFFRTLLFIPMMLSAALVAVVMKGLFLSRAGTLNNVLTGIGLSQLAQPWLTTRFWAYVVVIISQAWVIGLPMLYYSAGLSVVNPETLESAIIDGAGFRTIVWRLLFPLVRSSHITVTLTLMLASFRGFAEVFLLTGGGPGGSTEIVGTYIYRWFATSQGNMGYVSALSLITFVIAIVIGAIQVRIYQSGSGGR